MKYSEDRISHLAVKIHDKIYMDEDVDYTDEEKALSTIKKTMLNFFSLEDKIDTIVKDKLMKTKKNLIPGSREWDIMYAKYFEDEMKKH